jgi:aminoglycoside phosphotransferase (APT) family kinase protein
MSATYTQLRKPKPDIAIALVARAWEQVCLASGRRGTLPTAIVPLKPQRPARKSGIYRIDGVGEGGSPVVAKRSIRSTAEVERDVYERILPRVDVPALRYYGYLEEPAGEFGWLFLEYAGEEKLADADRAMVARWLARLHTDAAALQKEVRLPERGPAHYLDHLHAARRLIGEAECAPALDEDRHALILLQELSQRIESRWGLLCTVCATAPTTLVHGDFSRKNLLLRHSATGPQLVALDWETAGWGPPAADLPFAPTRAPPRQRPPGLRDKPPRWDGTVPLDVYAARAVDWQGRTGDLERMARLGTLFRAIAGIRWAAEQLSAGGTHTGMRKLRWYAELLPQALKAVNCP